MNANQLLSDFMRSQVVEVAPGVFRLREDAIANIEGYLTDKIDGEIAQKGYYLIFRLALERVLVDSETGEVSDNRATAANLTDFFNRFVFKNSGDTILITGCAKVLGTQY
jgi:hypothetical protein